MCTSKYIYMYMHLANMFATSIQIRTHKDPHTRIGSLTPHTYIHTRTQITYLCSPRAVLNEICIEVVLTHGLPRATQARPMGAFPGLPRVTQPFWMFRKYVFSGLLVLLDLWKTGFECICNTT